MTLQDSSLYYMCTLSLLLFCSFHLWSIPLAPSTGTLGEFAEDRRKGYSWRSRAVDQSLIFESAEAVAKSGVPLSG